MIQEDRSSIRIPQSFFYASAHERIEDGEAGEIVGEIEGVPQRLVCELG